MKESYRFWFFPNLSVPSLSLHKQMCGARCYLISSWWWLATINFVNVSPLLPSPCIQISNPDDPLIYARLHQHRQLVDQIFIDFSTDFTSSTSSLARHVTDLGFLIFPLLIVSLQICSDIFSECQILSQHQTLQSKPSAPICEQRSTQFFSSRLLTSLFTSKCKFVDPVPHTFAIRPTMY